MSIAADNREGWNVGTSNPQERRWRGDPADIVVGVESNPLTLTFLIRLIADWHPDALCAGEPAEVFFPGRGGSSRLAFELCGRCPVREICLAEALDDAALDFGVRGGLSANARKARRRLSNG
jgi:hypothetical protein